MDSRYVLAVKAQTKRGTPKGEAAYEALIQKWLAEDGKGK